MSCRFFKVFHNCLKYSFKMQKQYLQLALCLFEGMCIPYWNSTWWNWVEGLIVCYFTAFVSQQISEELGDSLGCASSPTLRILKYLDRICDDCYMLFRDPGVYGMCRSDCFSSSYFRSCMDIIMVSKQTRSKAYRFVQRINSYTTARLWHPSYCDQAPKCEVISRYQSKLM